jgi:hypothetical protein
MWLFLRAGAGKGRINRLPNAGRFICPELATKAANTRFCRSFALFVSASASLISHCQLSSILSAKKYPFGYFLFAGAERIELPPEVLETPVLPLNYAPIKQANDQHSSCFAYLLCFFVYCMSFTVLTIFFKL